MSRYTYLAWHRVSEPCQPPAKPGGVCVTWQTSAMRAPAFSYYDTLAEALETWPELAPQIAATAADLIDAGMKPRQEIANDIMTWTIPLIERYELRDEPVSWDWIRDFLAGLAADLVLQTQAS